jgi:hypothetical protein
MIPYDHFIHGQTVITDTTEVTGNFVGLYVQTDTVIESIEYGRNYVITGSWVDLGTIPGGRYLPGHFNKITLASGKAIAAHKR